MCLAQFIACMIESEDGLAKLDGINAKQLINRAIQQSLDKSALAVSDNDKESNDVSEVETTCQATKVDSCQLQQKCNNVTLSSHKGIVLKPPVITFLQQHVLPYLDDIVDAYLAPGSDALD